jgi:hypothetical protein
MTNSPSKGGIPCADEQEFRAFDSLPLQLREALNYAPANWSAIWARRMLKRGKCISSIIAAIPK